MAAVVSVNVGTPVDEEWAGNLRRTAIRKSPVTGPVRVRELGLDGDQVADTEHHGGTYQAVYAFAQEDLDFWTEQLGETVPPGLFGENLTTTGIDVNEAVVGERWRIGTALLQVIEVRIPCNVFKNWLGVRGYDNTVWVKRFTAEGRPGPYLRVLEEGTLRVGDPITVEHRPAHGATVSTMFKALTTDPALLPELLKVSGLPEKLYADVRDRVARTSA
ncbi:MAG: MOSC domain-containing protein [Nocardioidaceae bacterium]